MDQPLPFDIVHLGERGQHMCLILVLVCLGSGGAKPPTPHIVFIVADDLGINDVGYNNPDIISPNIDSLARSGIILNQSYVQPLCTPSRAAFMTGTYPFKLGLQHSVIDRQQAVCVPLNKTVLPQVLRANGYATHMVGKWHLGYCQWECTPTYRGFDSYYGFMGGQNDYYSKMSEGGYDFWYNTSVDRRVAGKYVTEQFTKRFEDILESHDLDTPLFAFLAYFNIHAPLQVPEHYLSLYPNVTDERRKYASAMATNLDDNIGRVVAALKSKGMYQDTVIVFTSDNGGWTTYGGNNYPLRGGKFSIFEGGTRIAAFVHSPMLRNKGVVYEGMIHAVDWFPTLAAIAGVNHFDPNQDGLDLWETITSLAPSKRNEFVYNLDFHAEPIQGKAAIRVGDFKLILGFPGVYDGWYLPGAPDQGLNFTVEVAFDGYLDIMPDEMIRQLIGITPLTYLFNLREDPEERHNLYDVLPDVARRLEARLDSYRKDYVPPNYPPRDPRASYTNFDGVWAPGWC